MLHFAGSLNRFLSSNFQNDLVIIIVGRRCRVVHRKVRIISETATKFIQYVVSIQN